MPNHVTTNVRFEGLNETAKARLQKLYSNVRKDQDYLWFSDMFVSKETPYEMLERRDWNIDNTGAKWNYFDDMDDDQFQITSAWDSPSEGIKRVIDELAEVCNDFLTISTYEDEFPNFIGIQIWKGNEFIEDEMISWDAIVEHAQDKFPELDGQWDEEEGDWKTEEAQDFWQDTQWEFYYDLLDEIEQETREQLSSV
jgi:hypothetical protein